MRNNRGFISTIALLAITLGGALLLFVQNPISNFLGIGVRPNKTVESTVEKVDFIKDQEGNIIATRTTTAISNKDIPQHVTFWDWLKSLPIIAVILMGSGVAFPVVGTILYKAWTGVKSEYKDLFGGAKNIAQSVKVASEKITDPIMKKAFFDTLSSQQDSSTKDLVKELLKNGS